MQFSITHLPVHSSESVFFVEIYKENMLFFKVICFCHGTFK